MRVGGGFHGEFPENLGRVLQHVRRFGDVLAQMERERAAGQWAVGRSSELRTYVLGAIADWRAGVFSEEKTLETVTSYLEGLHRDASERRGRGVVLECCSSDEAITLVPNAADVGSVVLVDSDHGRSHHSGATFESVATTEPVGWVDTPEVTARFQEGLRIVDEVAGGMRRRVGPAFATLDDLKAYGREGLMHAARTYDESKGPFGAWARLRIRGAMFEGVRSSAALPVGMYRKLQAMEAADNGGVGSQGAAKANEDERLGGRLTVLATTMGGARALESPEAQAQKAEAEAVLREVVATLPVEERELVERHFFGEQTHEEIAAAMGIGRPRVKRVLDRALARVRRVLEAREVDGESLLRLLVRLT